MLGPRTVYYSALVATSELGLPHLLFLLKRRLLQGHDRLSVA